MAQRENIHREGQKELEEESRQKKKTHQPLYDQFKTPDEGIVDFLAEPSPKRHAALLAEIRSDKQRANIVTQLQQSYGNAYVQRLLKSRTVRARLTVSQPDDDSEREADRVANIVLQTSAYPIQRQAEPEEEEEEEIQPKLVSEIQRQLEEEEEPVELKAVFEVQRQAEPEEEEEEEIQPKASSQVQLQPEEEEEIQPRTGETQLAAASEDLETRINAARGSGQSLNDSVRASLEPQFGHDFGDVRVHTDAEANRLSQQLGAEAFTTGRDIFFREGAYQPGSDSGKGLIAHELTHVVQQEGGTTAQIRQKAVEQSRDESTGIVQRVNGASLVGWKTQTISASNGYIHHQVGWRSSTDNLADMAHIRTREQISWPACPWPVMGMDAAYSAPGQHHGLTTTPATSGGNKDDHEAIRPYPDFSQLPTLLAKGQQTAPFVMNQVYQYSSDGGTTWHNIPGSQYTLTRTIRRKKYRGSRYVFMLTKQGVTDADVNITTTKTVKI